MGITTLPKDRSGGVIQALYPDQAQKITTSTTSAVNPTDFGDGASVIRVLATVPTFIRLGTSVTVATTDDHYLPDNVTEYFSLGADPNMGVLPATRLAAIVPSGTGVVYISTCGSAKPRGEFAWVTFQRPAVANGGLVGIQVGVGASVTFSAPAASGTLGLVGALAGLAGTVTAEGTYASGTLDLAAG